MIDRQRYQRTFGVLHASGEFLKEENRMAKKRFPVRKALVLCAAAALALGMSAVCYAADVGGIQRTIQLWIHGDQTTAVMDIQDGHYTLSYEDAEGNTQERGGGGVAIEPDGSERPLTEQELLEHLTGPEVEYREDGTVWLYYKDQAMEITHRFNEDGFCFAQVKDGAETKYVTVRFHDGYAVSSTDFIQPEEFH